MTAKLSPSANGLLAYLSNARERANEDQALSYFRSIFGESFQRQGDAQRADGYVPGSFVLELKSRSSEWLAGLCQGLAYQNANLDFAHVVVASDKLLCVWKVDDLPPELRTAVLHAPGAPNSIGKAVAREFAARQLEIRMRATWDGKALFEPLFAAQEALVAEHLRQFERLLITGEKRRIAVRPADIRHTLRDLKKFFKPSEPLRTVRAFYTMLYGWTIHSTVEISQRVEDAITIGGETVDGLIPESRIAFKDYVENRYIKADESGSVDEFFASYDVAVDAVDPQYRRKHGMYFTDLSLSRFVMWLARGKIPDLGHNYLVVDPACGSGNLVTNWRSPLDLRHKVVSEIDPELLFAVEQRLKGDAWHRGRFTVVPQVSEGRGLNFLDRTAEQYLQELSSALEAKGLVPDKPLAFLCNPPYRGDDDQAAGGAGYDIDPSIAALTGSDAERERYCCFLAQMKRVCEVAADSGLPGESLLLLFTKSAWLTRRAIFAPIRREILSFFEDVDGVLINGSEFFDVKGAWPVAFTIWRYKGPLARLNPDRAVPLRDLTHVRRRDLENIPWDDPVAADQACGNIVASSDGTVRLGESRQSLRDWVGLTMTDFKRDRRKAERDLIEGVGGLPTGDHRRSNKKTYGIPEGQFVGFMDDLTPCRIARGRSGRPWFRLNSQFMDAKKNRCFSGPPSHWGYCAEDLPSAKRLFFWYALARTFLQKPYPMWADAEDLWAPAIGPELEDPIYAAAIAIGYAENECVETFFPAHNPVQGTRELHVPNPMTPLMPFSFWSTTLQPYVQEHGPACARELVGAVDSVFAMWNDRFSRQAEIRVSYNRPYFIDRRPLTSGAGIQQIRDYAVETGDEALLKRLDQVRVALKAAREWYSNVITASDQVGYFHSGDVPEALAALPGQTDFQSALKRRLALAARIVEGLRDDPGLGRTKLVKLFYLADQRTTLDLRTAWAREAAGPLDVRALYHGEVGVEALALKTRLFEGRNVGGRIRYEGLENSHRSTLWIKAQLGTSISEVDRLITTCRSLDTDQCEIIATLYACWNDLLLRKRVVDDELVISEFLNSWHQKKRRFARDRLLKALKWMREHDLVPDGRGTQTRPRRVTEPYGQ